MFNREALVVFIEAAMNVRSYEPDSGIRKATRADAEHIADTIIANADKGIVRGNMVRR